MKKYVLRNTRIPKSERTRYAEDFDYAFFNCVLEAQIPPSEWLKEHKIASWGSWVIWVTNGEGDYCPVLTEELIRYRGEEPVGSPLEEFDEETA